MSKHMLLCVILVLIAASTVVKAGPMSRIERNIKSLDLKLNAQSMDISTLKHDVVEANNKLDLILEILNETTTTQNVALDTTSSTGSIINQGASDQVTSVNDLKVTLRGELYRVKQAFAAEKRKLTEQQKQNNVQFHELVQRVNDTLANVKYRGDTKCTHAAKVLDASVVSMLDTVRDDIRNQVGVLEQSIREHGKTNTNTIMSKLDIRDRSIVSVNSSIHDLIKTVDQTVLTSIQKSGMKCDDVTQKLRNELTSILNAIHGTVQAIDCPQVCVGAAAIHAHGHKMEELLGQLSDKLGNINVHVPPPPPPYNPFSGNRGRRPTPPPGFSRGQRHRVDDIW